MKSLRVAYAAVWRDFVMILDRFDAEFCIFEITFLEKGDHRWGFLRLEDEELILSSSSCFLLDILRAVRRVLIGDIVVSAIDDDGEKKNLSMDRRIKE